jgi:hypothetical protein
MQEGPTIATTRKTGKEEGQQEKAFSASAEG